jgi:hypothetical protein
MTFSFHAFSIQNNKGMTLLIFSGLLYLIGISIVLFLKPELMFGTDGKWKEFGLGRNHEQYTWLPFWLFAIMWAILSYILVLVIASYTGLGGVHSKGEVEVVNEWIEPSNVSYKGLKTPSTVLESMKKPSSSTDMKSGYYILDVNETMKKGIPKYTYLGPEAPNLVYHHTDNVMESNI